MKRVKADAALNGQTIREYVLMKLVGGEPRRTAVAQSTETISAGLVSSAEMPTPPKPIKTKYCRHGLLGHCAE